MKSIFSFCAISAVLLGLVAVNTAGATDYHRARVVERVVVPYAERIEFREVPNLRVERVFVQDKYGRQQVVEKIVIKEQIRDNRKNAVERIEFRDRGNRREVQRQVERNVKRTGRFRRGR